MCALWVYFPFFLPRHGAHELAGGAQWNSGGIACSERPPRRPPSSAEESWRRSEPTPARSTAPPAALFSHAASGTTVSVPSALSMTSTRFCRRPMMSSSAGSSTPNTWRVAEDGPTVSRNDRVRRRRRRRPRKQPGVRRRRRDDARRTEERRTTRGICVCVASSGPRRPATTMGRLVPPVDRHAVRGARGGGGGRSS